MELSKTAPPTTLIMASRSVKFSPRKLPPPSREEKIPEKVSPKGKTAKSVEKAEREREQREKALEKRPEKELTEEEKDILRNRGKHGPVSHLSLKAALPSDVRCLLYKQLDYANLLEMKGHYLFEEVRNCVEEIVLPFDADTSPTFLQLFPKLRRISGEIKESEEKKFVYHEFGTVRVAGNEEEEFLVELRALNHQIAQGLIFDHIQIGIAGEYYGLTGKLWPRNNLSKLSHNPAQNFTFRVLGVNPEKSDPENETGFYDDGFLYNDASKYFTVGDLKNSLRDTKWWKSKYWLSLTIARDLSLENTHGADEDIDTLINNAKYELRDQLATLRYEGIPYSELSISKSVQGMLGDKLSMENIAANFNVARYPITLAK